MSISPPLSAPPAPGGGIVIPGVVGLPLLSLSFGLVVGPSSIGPFGFLIVNGFEVPGAGIAIPAFAGFVWSGPIRTGVVESPGIGKLIPLFGLPI